VLVSLELGTNVYPARVTPVTVNVKDVPTRAFLRLLDCTVTVPTAFVFAVSLSVVALDHLPVTVAPDTGVLLESTIFIVAVP
jgi:hypothetical protein